MKICGRYVCTCERCIFNEKMQVVSFNDGVLIIDFGNNELISYTDVAEERIIKAVYDPESDFLVVQQGYFIKVSKLPEILQIRIHEIEEQIEALAK